MVESEIGKDAPALPPKKVFRSKFDLQPVQTYRKPPTEAYWALLHKLREMSHLSSLMKLALATIAVSLH